MSNNYFKVKPGKPWLYKFLNESLSARDSEKAL
jgi:hypothetical protein